MKNLIIYIIALSSFTFAQGNFERKSIFFGFGLNFGQNIHSAQFSELPGVPSCCPEYTEGTGLAFVPSIFAGMAITNNFYLQANLGYQEQSALLESTETTSILLPSGEFTDGLFTHSLDASISTIFLEPKGIYTIAGFNFLLGYRIGFISTNSFEQKEILTEPNNTGAFYNEETGEIIGRVRNQRNGGIQEMSTLSHGVSLGISYDFQLNAQKSWWVSPNLNYYMGFSEFIPESAWLNSTVSAGVSIKYSKKNKLELNKNEYQIDTIEVTKDYIAASYITLGAPLSTQSKETIGDTIFTISKINRIDTLFIQGKEPVIDYAKETPVNYTKPIGEINLIGLDNSGSPIPFDNIELTVELTREIYPLLPYVFFDENSEVIPIRYNKIDNAFDFNESSIKPSPINYHRNNLNIIGRRMAANPSSKITVYGYIDPTTEENCKLAEWRALAVKKYIVETFEVSPSRINTIADSENCFPKDRTRTKSEEGYAENRRVVIETDTPELLFAVSRAKYQEPKLTKPSTIIIDLKANNIKSPSPLNEDLSYNSLPSEANLVAPNNWKLLVSQGTNILLNETQNTTSAKLPIEINRYNATELNNLNPINVNLSVFDNQNISSDYSANIPIKKDTAAIEVEKLTLTLFEVSQAELNSRIKKEIKKFVAKLNVDSQINITGYSDNLGSAKANKSLSAVRAKAVEDYIKSISSTAKFGEVKGVGSEKFPPGLSSYESPEERFISRTVEIEIRSKRDK